jgi:putative DNA primase/helicase
MSDSIDRSFEEEAPGAEGTQRETSLKKLMGIIRNDEMLQEAFCFNLFTHDFEHAQDNVLLSPFAKKGTPLTDYDSSCVRTYIARKYNITSSRGNIEDAIIDMSLNKKYHPIRDYLEELKWDGVRRLDTWLADICGAEQSAYTEAVGRKMLVAAVKRVFEPGCYYAQLVILEGRQRMYKSRLVKEMGDRWYASIHLRTQDTKQIVEEMRGKWIIEIEELAGFSKQENEYMKAFLSRQSDRVRVAFGRRAEDFPRQSILIATMNPDLGENKYLMDQTGNVRYWPVKCTEEGKIEIDKFIDIRDQLFAEAMILYNKGEKVWLENEAEEQLAQIEQEKRLSVDPWDHVISQYLHTKAAEFQSEITTVMIAKEVLGIPFERINSGITRRIARCLMKNHWTCRQKTTKDRSRYYIPPTLEDPKPIDWSE